MIGIKNNYSFKDDFETYIFGQFILDKQIKENTKLRKDLNFKYISDLLVGFSKSDEWSHQDLFLKNWRMGCPNGGEYGPQLWNIPVLDPKNCSMMMAHLVMPVYI